MRPTKSKQKLFYHKRLRSLERRKWEFEKQARESKLYEEIPRTLVGYKVHLEEIESLRNKDEGLSEAIAASTSYFRFSEKPFRLCNLKSFRTIFNGNWGSGREKMEAFFFKDKIYQKGKLELLDIREEQYKNFRLPHKNILFKDWKNLTVPDVLFLSIILTFRNPTCGKQKKKFTGINLPCQTPPPNPKRRKLATG